MIAVLIFAFLIPIAVGQGGGMAELKSITGDEPYSGQGPNAPLPIPQPMGFWGRPRYSPMYYPGGVSMMYGRGSPYYYGTSFSRSPYGVLGPEPFDDSLSNLLMDVIAPPYYRSLAGRPSFRTSSSFPTSGNPFSSSPPRDSFRSSSSGNHFGSSTFDSSPSSAPSSSGSVSLSSATGGGFYKGKGNDFIGR